MMDKIKKALTITSISIGNSFIYRAAFFTRLLTLLITLSFQFFFWREAFVGKSEIANYSFNSFFAYLILANLVYEFMQPNNVMVSTQILEGELNHFLLLPYRFMSFIFWKLVGDRIAFLITTLIPLVVGLFAIKIFSSINLGLSFLGLAFLVFFVVGGLALHFLIDFGIGLLAFWFNRCEFVFIVKEISLRILAGLWFPFAILPNFLEKVFSLLPFQFLGYVPSQSLLSPEIMTWKAPLLLIFWIFALYFLNILIWKLGIKRYEAFSG